MAVETRHSSKSQDDARNPFVRAAVVVCAIVSVMLMAYAGRANPSRLLVLVFAVWVLSPFAAFFAADASRRLRGPVLSGVAMAMAGLSIAIYAAVAFNAVRAKIGFVFLVVPAASWLLLAATVAFTTARKT